MAHILKSHHPVRHVKSFKYAFEGIFHALLNEANFRIQLFIALVAVGLGFYYGITSIEWGLLVISMGTLLSSELVNTLVEEFIDMFVKDQRPEIKVVKDVAAGFVLVAAITASAIIFIIFGHRIL
jgi:undecaprenol kinase